MGRESRKAEARRVNPSELAIAPSMSERDFFLTIPWRQLFNRRRAGAVLWKSVEIEGKFDRPFDFLHLRGWKRTEFSNEDGPLNDGDPLRLNH